MDIFSSYEAGVRTLLERVGRAHPRYAEVLTYQARLQENIWSTRTHGDSPTLQQNRAEVLARLNDVALEILGLSFNELCSMGGQGPASPAHTPAAAAPASPAGLREEELDVATIRTLVNAAYDDTDLTTLCFDYFRPVYERFAGGMGKKDKVLELVKHCESQGQLGKLLTRIEKHNPYQYQKHRDALRK
jgi:hypothetical protein